MQLASVHLLLVLTTTFIAAFATTSVGPHCSRFTSGAGDDAESCKDDRGLIQIGKEQRSMPQASGIASAANHKIFTYWDYAGEPKPLVKLNVRSWLAHAPPGTDLVLVNESNFHSLIPDAPPELFKLPYAACKSDVVRAAVLYHHGGLYLDTDFVVMKPLSSVFAKLDEGWDVVAYGDNAGLESGTCAGNYFTSNFMAARKGNPVSATWWENIKAKLTRTCGQGEFETEKVCCHEAFRANDPNYCHIPWGHLEWLKNPAQDADDSELGRASTSATMAKLAGAAGKEAELLGAVLLGNKPAKRFPIDSRIFCFQGRDGLAPHLNGEVYWQKWDAMTQATSHDTASSDQYDVRFQCKANGDDLECTKGNWGEDPRKFSNFFGRIAYHLFFSTRALDKGTPEDTLTADWLIAELHRRSMARATAA